MEISINFSEINWLSVIVVTILNFPLGAFWHSKLFGKAWMEDAKPVFDHSNKSNYIKLFSASAILQLIMVIGLDLLIGVNSTAIKGLMTGLGLSIFFVSTTIAITHLFVGRTLRLILLDTGFYIVYFSIAGLILGLW